MSFFEKGLRESSVYRALCADLKAERQAACVTGLSHIHKAVLTHALSTHSGKTALLLTGDEAEAVRLCEDLCALGTKAAFLPARDLTLHPLQSASREYEQQRLSVFARLMTGELTCAVASVDAAVQYTLPPSVLAAHTLTLTSGKPLPVSDLPAALVAAGYERCQQIEGAGQFAVRGGIVDIYPAAAPSPIRLELWGDTVDTLSYFDLLSQRRTDPLEVASIAPAAEIICTDHAALANRLADTADALNVKHEAVKQTLYADADTLANGENLGAYDRYLSLLYDAPATLFDYAPQAMIVLSESARIKERMRTSSWQRNEDIEAMLAEGRLCRSLCDFALEWDPLLALLSKRNTVWMETFSRTHSELPLRKLYTFAARQLPVWSGSLEPLCEDLRDALSHKHACVVLAGSEEKNAQTLAEDLIKRDIPALYAPSPDAPVKGRVLVVRGGLSAGFACDDGALTVITHGRPPALHRSSHRNKAAKKAEIHSLAELSVGDYIVHVTHGIAVYQGIHQLKVQGVIKDYLKLQYDKGDVLYVPVTQLDLVSKYIGAKDDVKVKVHRLGGQEWQKTKTRIRTAVKDIAKQLIALYAARMASKGFAFEPDSEWQYDFERHFAYQETEDQLRCVNEIKNDMERPIPMDRLLCGDVGFGKTEVALRAAFKCVSQSKQCVILVPTTILAFQHFNTVSQRFEGFPVRVEMLSRFRTAKQQQEILKATARGEVDILIGTHRMLSKDVQFRDLGLFIVDEEQRFGVAQKERIKELSPNVDVLTLSATPIPRTLNMAMSGIRDMSVIEEAPQDRRPVQTYVLEHDHAILADAMRKELRRGGQVYYLHNRVESIEACAAAVQRRLPEARVGFAHGKMTEEQLSDIWRAVMEHEIDILVCTTIIETGVDIPNVNTLIIENADRFGLSQLHQLRGRVGRSSRRAFAYLTFVRGKALSDVATKRLEAMREFTEFGAGFKIALRDMEIRGAGNLLGAQQHGHMEAVGYELYIRILEEAVLEEKGIVPKKEAEATIDLRVNGYIPERYIKTPGGRIEMYKKIAAARTRAEIDEVCDEMLDRFGNIPKEAENLCEISLLRARCEDCGIVKLEQRESKLIIYPTRVEKSKAVSLALYFKGRVLLSMGQNPCYNIKLERDEDPLKLASAFVTQYEKLVETSEE